SQVNFNSTYHDTTSPRAYKQSITKRLLSLTLTFTTELMEVDKSLGMFLDENERITLDGLGEKTSGGELLLIPINPSDMVAYHFPNALLIYDGIFSFNENKEHSLKLQFEASFDEREVLFERIPVDESLRVTLEDSLTIEPAALERAMTAYIADKMDMTVDTDIFRGGIPINIDACGVALVGQKAQNDTANRYYTFCISYRDSSRDKLMQAIHKLANQFPLYGEEINVDGDAIVIKALLKDSIKFDEQAEDNGKIKHEGELSLIAVI
ncbi:MAG: hypothetical protein KOO69_05935, partial [Victivallales bacterium]|nr:hypothetical protein [Victivallales bacterium]